MDGLTVANSWADLTDGSLVSAINKTEVNGTPPSSTTLAGSLATWSATNSNGTRYTAVADTNCVDWTWSSAVTHRGHIGLRSATSGAWSSNNNGLYCAAMAPLYCIEQ